MVAWSSGRLARSRSTNSHSQRFSLGHHERNPARKEQPHRDGRVTQQPVHLFNGVFRVQPFRNSQALPDVVYGEGCRMQHADNAVGRRKRALRMKIIADNLLNELVHVPG